MFINKLYKIWKSNFYEWLTYKTEILKEGIKSLVHQIFLEEKKKLVFFRQYQKYAELCLDFGLKKLTS